MTGLGPAHAWPLFLACAFGAEVMGTMAGMDWENGRSMARRRPWRLFGIPLQINTSWFFVVAFLTWSLANGYFPARAPGFPIIVYWAMGLVAALLLFACVLLHELGHSLVAKAHGVPVSQVTLFLFGGVALIANEPRRPSVELKITLAGPLVSGLLAAGCVAAAASIRIHSPAQAVVVAILRYLAIVNTGILLFNLLPGFPLDGGRVLRAALWAWTGDIRRATRIASRVGSLLAIGLLALGVWAAIAGRWGGGMWYILLGLFLQRAAQASYRHAATPTRSVAP